jgi:mono/diheme cytochrome c family protein
VSERLALSFLVLLLALVLGLGGVACGGGDDDDGTATDTTTEPTNGDDDAFAAGRTVFIDNCGTCHTLADAETTGTTGPALDDTELTAATIEEQVRNGSGVMPAFEGDLSDQEIQDVSAYVDEAAG